MRNRMALLLVFLALPVLIVGTWSLTLGQPPAASPERPPASTAPKETSSVVPVRAEGPAPRDLAKYTPLQKQMYLGVQRGADWLFRANRADGRFDYGYVPALATVMEGDHYLRQAGAAFALARASRFTGDERHAARARQAILTLLGDTTVDPSDATIRYTSLPGTVVNRLASAGLLVLAINELPAPEKDLLDQSEQLCNYIRKQQRPNGSLALSDQPGAADDPDGVNYYPGEALYGLIRSQAHRPAPWKLDVMRKAVSYYRAWWREHKGPAFVPWQTAAAVEAHLLTKEQPFADFVFEMNDWLCGLQYEQQVDLRRATWVGGFRSWQDGKPQDAMPTVASASCAESLAEACRTARQAVDLPRYRRYSEALERCLQFVTTLQYNEANTQHFAGWYRAKLVGGFHASEQDGNLRIDYTQHAVSAMAQYLTHVARP